MGDVCGDCVRAMTCVGCGKFICQNCEWEKKDGEEVNPLENQDHNSEPPFPPYLPPISWTCADWWWRRQTLNKSAGNAPPSPTDRSANPASAAGWNSSSNAIPASLSRQSVSAAPPSPPSASPTAPPNVPNAPNASAHPVPAKRPDSASHAMRYSSVATAW